MSQQQFLSRGIDYLGDLGAKLKDLQGFATLAYELIQNADDAEGVTSMAFDIRSEALLVENNGGFSDCLHVDQLECPWKTAPNKGHRCDFHRFRHVASGDKRDQHGTTGAFGIGFISVYQITDQPEFISSGRHWILHEDRPEDERIEICSGCDRCRGNGHPKTRFILPWCSDPNSKLRLALRAEATTSETPSKLLGELERSLPTAMLFLKSVDCIEIKVNGILRRKFERLLEQNSLILTDGDAKNDRIWRILSGDFDRDAQSLRQRHPGRIEDKRTAKVTLAIPLGDLETGLLCACLPSQHEIGLPFHINADFFPSNDRKHVIFESDFQSDWNRAALRAAAATLASALPQLPGLVGHRTLWNCIARLQQVADEAMKGQREKTLAEFWTAVEPKLKNTPIIFTTKRQWKKPGEACILYQDEEVPAIGVLEGLGASITHEDLRTHFTILRWRVGVPLFGLAHLTTALARAGLTARTERKDWPKCLQAETALETLWREVSILARREDGKELITGFGPKASQLLANAVIALGDDGALWPCREVYRADEKTRSLFQKIDPTIPFIKDYPVECRVIGTISPEFNAAAALRRLNDLGADGIREASREKRLDPASLLAWLEERKSEILADPKLKEGITHLHIFPASGDLRPLDGLSLPGNFDDPLTIAALVDLTALGGRSEFLRDLGAADLSFQVYAADHLPPALSQEGLPVEKRRQAVVLLAEKMGEIVGDESIRQKLRQVPIVEYQDDEFRDPVGVYFCNDVVLEVLGANTPFAILPKGHEASVSKFYEWIGVCASPRFEDIVSRVRQAVKLPPNERSLDAVRKIVSHLGERLAKEAPRDSLAPLRTMAWLPARSKADRWYKPDELHAVYQAYLFESQAYFLDVPANVQNASRALLEFLGIHLTPTAVLVVKHLIHCATNRIPVNAEVYRFLNDKVDDPALSQLKGKECLWLGDTYRAPGQVFWGEHPFGRYRWRLGEELRGYGNLLKQLGVRDTSDYRDALSVLGEISSEYSATNTPLDEDSHAVLMACWRALENGLNDGSTCVGEIEALRAVKCVPNADRVLYRPDWMFFENRAGLAAKFGEFLTKNVIPRPLDASNSLTAAGVRSLGSAVKIELLECADPIQDSEITERIHAPRNEIGRVLHSQGSGHGTGKALDRVASIQCKASTSIVIRYRLSDFNSERQSPPEQVPALYQPEQETLLFIRRDGQIPWAAIARELAVALFPEEDPGRFAAGLKEVLAQATAAEASMILDELGFARLDTDVQEVTAAAGTVSTLGADLPYTHGPPEGAALIPEPAVEPQVLTAKEAIDLILSGDIPLPTPPVPQPDTEPRGVGGLSGGGKKPKSKKKGRPVLRSYLPSPYPSDGGSADGDDEGDGEGRSPIDEAGVRHVLEYETACGRFPKEMPHKNPGYDVESRDASGKVVRYIEVKSFSGQWSDTYAVLSRPQFDKASGLGDAFWLYVVERAESDDFSIQRIQNPALKANHFMFDDGWRATAERPSPSEERK